MPEYAVISGKKCVAVGRVSVLPIRSDIIERFGGVPGVGDILEMGVWIVPEAPEPEPVTIITRLAFMEKFTTTELVAIYTEAKTAVELEVFLDKVKAADEIDLTDSRTREGVAVLESMGLIGEGRAVEILAGA